MSFRNHAPLANEITCFLVSTNQQTGHFLISQRNYVFVCFHQWEGRQGSNGRKQSIRRNREDKLNSERDEEECLTLENKNKLSRQLPLFTGWARSTQPLEEGEGLYRRLALLHPTLGGIQCSGPSPPNPWGRYSALALLHPTLGGGYSALALLHPTLGGDTVLWPFSTQPLIRGYSALALLYPTVWGVGGG